MFISDPRLSKEDIVKVGDEGLSVLPEMVFSAVKTFNLTASCAGSLSGHWDRWCLLKTAHDAGLRRFTIQDYWGYINPVTTHYHDIIFVLINMQKKLANTRSSASVEIVGNPKYDCYKDLDISALQARFFEEYGLDKQKAIIGFIGQPLSHFDGYLNL